MKVNITPTKSNTHSLKGIIIKGHTPNLWLNALQFLNVDLVQTPIYAIASANVNELYGCFVMLSTFNESVKQLNVILFQSIHDYIYIPEFSKISPKLSKKEAESVFNHPHIFHPDFGWVTLNEPILWNNILQLEQPQHINITKPAKTIYSPQTIKSFQLIADEEIDIIKALDLKVEPPKKETLNGFDKAKLKLFKTLFTSKQNSKGGFDVEGKGLFKWLNTSANRSHSTKSKWKKDFEKLLLKNQKETDKLLSLFKSNPNLALSRALPLDMLGTSRDDGGGVFKVFGSKKGGGNSFSKLISKLVKWGLFFIVALLAIKLFSGITNSSLLGLFTTLLKVIVFTLVIIIILAIINSFNRNTKGADNSATIDSERMEALRKEYEKLADEAIKNKDYKKAASIYIKLLKNHFKAATILEEGKYYQEAALIHLKFTKNKELAAKAYESGKFYNKAIPLYTELNRNEKVGDLYKLTNNKMEADKHYQIVIDNYLKQSQYVKASLVYKYKIEDTTKAQAPLLKGWRENNDAYNCLNNYFGNFSNEKLLKQGIHSIYKEETNSANINTFLKALKHEYTRHETLKDYAQHIAFDAVANYIKDNPSIAFALSSFNPDNSLLNTDTSKFVKQEKKKRRQ
ncbi:hypothetical protein [Pontimicrobium sp. MEBiC06410]